MITSIRLQNYRSYLDASFEFEPGANIIVGPNASGKTNLLEAVMFLAGGNSYRAKDQDLINHASSWARLDGFSAGGNRSVKLEAGEGRPSKSFLIGDKAYKRLGLENSLPLVYFEPEHLQSLTRGPERRRDYFDDILERTIVGYKQLSSSYRRALAQRNALLKKGRLEAAKQTFAWNVRLAELGQKIAEHRTTLNELINKKLSSTYSHIAGKKTLVEIDYARQFPIDAYASQMVKSLEKNLNKDLERGFTGSGPHREDFIFSINGRLINTDASRGEVRTILLSLKKIELELIEKAREVKPILLLDDVLSELDGSRRQALVDLLKDHQSILTTTDADTVLEYFTTGTQKVLAINK